MNSKIAAIKLAESSFVKYYDPDNHDLRKGDFCVVEVKDKDYEDIGFITGFEGSCPHCLQKRNLPKVIRKATPPEIEQWHKIRKKEREAIVLCKEKVKKYGLNMKVTNVRFDTKNNKVIYNFIADKRVDFRELVKDLAAALRSRIDLWQIGVRDEARMICSFGVCGQELCCARYIKDFQPISIKMAKEQDIFVSPTKLSGVCGRLMCCLNYEYEHYAETNKDAPPIGATVVLSSKVEGLVIERNLLRKTIIVEDEQGNKHKAEFAEITSMRVPENLESRQHEILRGKADIDEDSGEIPPDDDVSNSNNKR